MDRYQGTGLIVLVLLLSLTGICCAADSPEYLGYLHGEGSVIVNTTEDMMTITVSNPDTVVNITKDGNTTSFPVSYLTNMSTPIDAVVVFNDKDSRSSSIVKIENLTFSDDKRSLTLQVQPLDYYDRTLLSPYAQETQNLRQLNTKTFNATGVFMELIKSAPDNAQGSGLQCDTCVNNCRNDPNPYDCVDICTHLVCG
nr:hypothetical protein [uncultured Methanospirillum sp.]